MMKPIALVTVLFFAAVPLAPAQGMKDMDIKNMPMKSDGATAHKATGVVKLISLKKNSVTLAHEPVASLALPAMTMAFKVEDKKLLDRVTVGKKVDVEFKRSGNDYVITSLK